jgi:hypothetical protein
MPFFDFIKGDIKTAGGKAADKVKNDAQKDLHSIIILQAMDMNINIYHSEENR